MTLGGSDNKFHMGPACGYSGMVTVLELKTDQGLYCLGFAVPHKRSIFKDLPKRIRIPGQKFKISYWLKVSQCHTVTNTHSPKC